MDVVHPFYYMFLAGVLFGTWPLVMNLTGLSGMQSAMWFGTGAAVLILVFVAVTQGVQFSTHVRWGLVIFACCLGGAGLILLNIGLANSTPKDVSKMFLVMVVAQIAVPSIYHTVMNGGIDLKTGAGIVCAMAAAILLT